MINFRITTGIFADIMGVSVATIEKWNANNTYVYKIDSEGKKYYETSDLLSVENVREMVQSDWEREMEVTPLRKFTSVELFAGAGGLALGLEKAGFEHVLLNEFDHSACETLRFNRPKWNVIEQDVRTLDFTSLRGKVDFLSGGFPCQAFSYAGKQGGFSDTRGTLFFELARAVDEIRPKVFMGENVRGLEAHDNGRTLQTIKNAIRELGYTLVEPRVLQAIKYQVPQKRERLILIAIRNDIADKVSFHWPQPYHRVMTLRDAFYKGELFDCDVPKSPGASYPEKKQKVLAMVPAGGDWRDLPVDVQKEYMGGSFYLGGGKTGMARRLSLDEPSLTLTCAPAQKQTERCHPLETRPLTVREYARIQTFPDEWKFSGNQTSQYKQIGNAVPVNLAYAIGRSLIRLFNDIELLGVTNAQMPLDADKDRQIPFVQPKVYHVVSKQLELAFEDKVLYAVTNKPTMLVGSCRQAQKQWIVDNNLYNYPIEADEMDKLPMLEKATHLIVRHRKTEVGYYKINGVEIVDKAWLKEKGYPVKSSKHKADAKYILYTLKPLKQSAPSILPQDCEIVLGKAAVKSE